MMRTIYSQEEWFDQLLPEGIPVPSLTLLSGPGGSGKPLIGNVLVAAWLRQGGSVVFMSLQYPDHSFIAASLKSVTQLDLDDYKDRIVFIELDASLEGLTRPAGNHFKANVVIPEVWDAALERACRMVPAQGPGILVFASALNLLLFSPTYGRSILEKIKATIGDHKCTYLFSTSTTANAEEIAELEAVADNLIMTRSEKRPFCLYMQIKRMKNVAFLADEIEVPIPANVLLEVKEVADHSRKRIIPLISKI
jgi:KaiC/GvpD/RAD55 family RecA-like ATPase